jgi:hypothetical protein
MQCRGRESGAQVRASERRAVASSHLAKSPALYASCPLSCLPPPRHAPTTSSMPAALGAPTGRSNCQGVTGGDFAVGCLSGVAFASLKTHASLLYRSRISCAEASSHTESSKASPPSSSSISKTSAGLDAGLGGRGEALPASSSPEQERSERNSSWGKDSAALTTWRPPLLARASRKLTWRGGMRGGGSKSMPGGPGCTGASADTVTSRWALRPRGAGSRRVDRFVRGSAAHACGADHACLATGPGAVFGKGGASERVRECQ